MRPPASPSSSAARRVVIALAGLLLVPTAAIRSMAVGAIVVVLVSMLACATLLPALLTVVGQRIKPGEAGLGRWFRRWSERVTARPAPWLAGALALLLRARAAGAGAEDRRRRAAPVPQGLRGPPGLRGRAHAVRGQGDGAPLKILTPPKTPERRGQDAARRSGGRPDRRADADQRQALHPHHRQPRHNPDAPEVKELIKRLRADLPAGTLVGGNTRRPGRLQPRDHRLAVEDRGLGR